MELALAGGAARGCQHAATTLGGAAARSRPAAARGAPSMSAYSPAAGRAVRAFVVAFRRPAAAQASRGTSGGAVKGARARSVAAAGPGGVQAR